MSGPDLEVERYDGELGQVESVRRAALGSIRAYVRGYVGYRERTAFTCRREAPSGFVPLIIDLSGTLRLRDSGDAVLGGGVREFESGLLAGPTTSVGIVDSGGAQSGIQLDFSPVGAALFLGRPLHEIAERVIGVDEAFGGGGRGLALVERLRRTPLWSERFAVLDEALADRFAASGARPGAASGARSGGGRGAGSGVRSGAGEFAVSGELVEGWTRLVRSRGAVRISALSEGLEGSRSAYVERFRRAFGLPPKTYARIMRFRAAVRWVEGSPRRSLSDIALDCGYYDQAHLDRDFRAFAGISPSRHRALHAGPFGVRAE